MPRAKRALEETDANAQAAPAAKNQKRSKKQEEAKKPSENVEKENAVEGCTSPCGKRQTTADKNPEDYICIPQPFPDFEYQQRESGGKAKSVNLDRQYNQTIIGPNEGKLLGLAQPGDKWVIMKAAWDLYKDLTRWETYCNPDNFGMYIYNDFYGYGVKALIEQQLAEFNKELRKKEASSKHMWNIMTALGHWLFDPEVMGVWTGVDDGEGVNALVSLIGCAFLTMLNEIDRSEQMKADSEFRDLGLVMSLHLNWSCDMPDYGIGEDGETDWRESVVAYAKKAGIDLKATGCSSTTKSLEGLEDVEALSGDAKADRWQWTKNFKEHKKQHGIDMAPLKGGNQFDITKWSRAERKAQTFDGKDPLADVPLKVLREGGIMLA